MPRRVKRRVVTLRFDDITLYRAFIARRWQENKHVPILVEPLTKSAPKSTESVLYRELPDFTPLFEVPQKGLQILAQVTTALALFLMFLGEESLQIICRSTNAKADLLRQPPHPPDERPWHPLTRAELLR